jgi:hypothetical protein
VRAPWRWHWAQILRLAGLWFAVAYACYWAPILYLGVGAWFVFWVRRGTPSTAPPPPAPVRPSCDVCAGHELLDVTPLEGRKGMWIYKSAPLDRPNHTHIHIAEG